MASRQAACGVGERRRRTRRRRCSRSPPASPIDRARARRPRPRAPSTRRDLVGRRPHTTTRRRLAEARLGRGAVGAEREVDAEPDLAAERHLAQRDREAAVAHVVHAGDLALARRARRRASCSARAAVEIGDRRHPAVETVHDRGPLRTAELRRGSRRARRSSSPARSRGARRRVRELVDQAEHADDRRRDGCRRRATRCRRRRCRRSPGCRALRTPRSCLRRLRRTATSLRGARGCRS